ncbi:unnamed protein product [Dracunculus medinensis]|uniref:DUF2232 domain-containing protein n=1 Tax=Dracunculus medinensis TaxID=318479 RepID=A0A0N4UFS0_DRAME|nr:unnamed protein product [Dracunculus medinensis]
MVLEQKILMKSDVPALLAVGLEGVFGFLILSFLLIPMYLIVPPSFLRRPGNHLEDILDAFYEISRSSELVVSLLTIIASIAFFNFAGISVTKYMSATTRMVLDNVRTFIIWGLSVFLFHSRFIPLQVFYPIRFFFFQPGNV